MLHKIEVISVLGRFCQEPWARCTAKVYHHPEIPNGLRCLQHRGHDGMHYNFAWWDSESESPLPTSLELWQEEWAPQPDGPSDVGYPAKLPHWRVTERAVQLSSLTVTASRLLLPNLDDRRYPWSVTIFRSTNDRDMAQISSMMSAIAAVERE